MGNSHFPTAELGPLCSKIGSGATPRGGDKVYLDRGEVALIRSQNVHNDGFSREGLVYIAEEHAEQLSNVTVESEDVLLNITGDSVARCCQVDPGVLPARVNQHVAIIRPNPEELHPRFLRYFLVSPAMQSEMLAWSHAGATRKALTKGMIESFNVPKPDPTIQGRIAHILGTLDDKIELNRRMNRTLEKMAAAIFKSWFIDFDPVHAKADGRDTGLPAEIADLFPDSFQDSSLGPIPKGWKARPLPEAIDINPKRTLAKGALAPFLEMSNMPTRGPSPDAWRLREMGSGMKFVNGDTLVARITPCLENGKTAFVDFLADGEVGWGSTEYIVLRPLGDIPPVFAYLLARTSDFRNFAIQQMTGSSGRQRVAADSLTKYQIVGPEIDSPIFRAFGQIVTPLFRRIIAASRQSRNLSKMRDTLLPKLMNGELDVPSVATVTQEAK
ncbi:MAG: restriction endonuclease subunit S [Candidatus Hydrogenedentes bacterium]|nr:restriction endonuclease subunit S [Candidatus Hydrogenedentota bacterium]